MVTPRWLSACEATERCPHDQATLGGDQRTSSEIDAGIARTGAAAAAKRRELGITQRSAKQTMLSPPMPLPQSSRSSPRWTVMETLRCSSCREMPWPVKSLTVTLSGEFRRSGEVWRGQNECGRGDRDADIHRQQVLEVDVADG